MEKLSKNFIWLAAANIISSLFSITIFIYLARVLKPEAFGYLSYAQTLIFYLLNFVDLGLSIYGIREVSKNRVRAREYVSEIVSFKFLIAGLLFAAFLVTMFFSRNTLLLKILMAESALLLLTSALTTEWAFQGLEKMQMVFVSLATTTGLQLALIYTFVKGPNDLLKVPILYSLGTIPIILLFLRIFSFKPMLNALYLKNIKFYLSSSLVIWSISIFAQVYNGLDIVLLGLFRNPTEVSYFTVARRAVGGITLLLIVIVNALLPRLSCTFASDMLEFKKSVRKFLKLAIVLTFAVFLPIMIFDKWFIMLTFGNEYLPSRAPLNIMMGGIILVLFNLPFSTALIAACFEKEVLKQVAACACISVAMNLIMMPRYGMTGAAISFLMTEAVALAWILTAYRKKIKI